MFLASCLAVGFLGWWLFHIWLRQVSLQLTVSQRRWMNHLERVIRNQIDSSIDPAEEPQRLRRLVDPLPGVSVAWTDRLGRMACAGSCPHPLWERQIDRAAQQEGAPQRTTGRGFVRSWRDENGRTWVLMATDDEWRSLLGVGASLLAGCLLLNAAFIAVAVMWFHRKIHRPLNETAVALRALQANRRPVWLMPESDAMRPLTEAVNALVETWTRHIRRRDKEYVQWAAVLAAMSEGVLVVDERERIVFINEAARKFLRWSSPTAERPFLIEVSRDPRLKSMHERVIVSKRPERTEIVRRDGEQRWLLEALPVSDHDGWEAVVMMLRDITEFKRLDAVRRDFVANVSHELRTPVTNIQGYAETLADHAGEMNEDEQKRCLDVIVGESKRLAQLIADTLTLARWDALPHLETRPMDVVRLVRDIVQTTAATSARRHQVEIFIDGCNGIIWPVDPFVFRQIMSNLIDNAVKYNRPGGRVDIRVAVREETLIVTVSDDGIGIPSEHLPFVFDRFYRVDKSRCRHTGGTGLGLSIVRQAVEIHGGSVSCRSKEGVGTTFTVSLPRNTPPHSSRLHA